MKHNKLNFKQVQEDLSKKFEILMLMKQINLRTISHRSGILKEQGVDAFSILYKFLNKNL